MIRNPWTHRNIKFLYYAHGMLREGLRRLGHRKSRQSLLKQIKGLDSETLHHRLAYYCKSDVGFTLGETAVAIGDLKLPEKSRTYYFDLMEYACYFPDRLTLCYAFGDVTHIPYTPTLVKSRPIQRNNENAVLFKLNKVRHFTFTHDRTPYHKKKRMLLGRAKVYQEHRRAFFRQYVNHPMCNLGQINSGTPHDEWIRQKMSINQHLAYKFIWCQEGNDVATNLKWVMSSNSIAVMPRPKYETWFMEGTLQPNVHYIAVRDDFSDLEERLTYYLEHPNEALEIIRNAQQHVQQFKNPKLEKALCLLVLDRYFVNSRQLELLWTI